MNITEFKFEGVDSFNRPVFKAKVGLRIGSVDKLFSQWENPDYILKNVEKSDMIIFGDHFNCEPLGTKIVSNKIKLVKEFSSKEE